MVVHFCPYCHNLLLTEYGNEQFQFYCKTCPYVFRIKKKISTKLYLERKKVDDILGGEAWKMADTVTGIVNPRRIIRKLVVKNVEMNEHISFKCKLDLQMNQ